jgi:hypothetical protein
MTDRQQNTFRMFLAVKGVYNKNRELIAGYAPLKVAFDDFLARVDAIQQESTDTETDTAGSFDQKLQIKEAMSLSDHRGRHCLGAGKGGGLPGPPGEGRRPEQPQCDVYGQYEDAFQRSTRPALPAH